GVELLIRARAECPEALRIIFTGYADLKAVIDAVNRAEIHRYLTKPWDPDDLCATLHEACKHHEARAERRRLLGEMRDHLARGLTTGTCNSAEWAGAGRALLERANRLLDGS